ncbi:MAG: sulfurtransferase-like selenium metabolism protein YedF [Pseudomonadota bacterium]
MEKKIDCTALQCPAPVLKTKELLEKYPLTKVDILVDNDAAVENVSRFLTFNDFEISVDSDGIVSTVSGQRSPEKARKLDTTSQPGLVKKSDDTQKILIIISSTNLGKGDDDLGGKLMINFIKTLKEMGNELWRLVFVNHGVMLCAQESALLDELAHLQTSGVNILVCGACLTHLGLMDKKAVGETTNMLDIVTSMQLADKVISL